MTDATIILTVDRMEWTVNDTRLDSTVIRGASKAWAAGATITVIVTDADIQRLKDAIVADAIARLEAAACSP